MCIEEGVITLNFFDNTLTGSLKFIFFKKRKKKRREKKNLGKQEYTFNFESEVSKYGTVQSRGIGGEWSSLTCHFYEGKTFNLLL